MVCFMDFSKKASNEEEYKKMVESRIRGFYVVTLAGALALGVLNESLEFLGGGNPNIHRMNGFWTGVGTGIIIVGIIQILRLRKLLKNEAALRAGRIKSQDERNLTIMQRSVNASVILLLIVSYLTMLVAGYYNEMAFKCFWFIIILFSISLVVFRAYYSRKM